MRPGHSGAGPPISGLPEIGIKSAQVGYSRLGLAASPESRGGTALGSGFRVRDLGSLAEPVIGPRFARTRWLAPRNDELFPGPFKYAQQLFMDGVIAGGDVALGEHVVAVVAITDETAGLAHQN